MQGWVGTILQVDLGKGQITKDPLDEGFAASWVGGEGFGAKLLWDAVGPEVVDGLDPRNILVYASGPLTGTLAPSSGRLEIITKSALTGIFGDSNSGGNFAPEFKQAGYDAIVIKGKAEKPVYLWIDDDKIEIRDASYLWGKSIPETDEMLKQEIGDRNIQVSCIGPAGENLIRFATIANNLVRTAGWGGVGAVAGSKKLKAIAVRGRKGIRVGRPEEFEKACWEARQKLEKKVGPLLQTRRKMGTMYLGRFSYLGGNCHLNNYTVAQCSEERFEKISGEKFAEEYISGGPHGCYGCVQHCAHFVQVKEGAYRGLASEGFEYAALGPYLSWYGSDNLAFAMAAAKYCNDFGLDTAESAMLLGWATECFQRGILTEKDTDGLELNFGDEKVGLELLRKMVCREGLGDILAEGVARAAQLVGKGSEYYSYSIKGKGSNESPTRVSYGCALASATSTRGADHLKGWPQFELSGGSPRDSLKLWGHKDTGDRSSHQGKAPLAIYNQRMSTL
ncbi:aldehyde ferredoxin oxidoreductase family protein, partial [Chloroflexota bacterium]